MERSRRFRRAGLPARIQRTGVEWLIAVGRILLAVVALVTLGIDPTTPAALPLTTFVLLSVYLVYAGIVLLLAWRYEGLLLRIRWLSHVIDLSVFAALMYSSEGPNSPFFLFFSLSLVAAVLRWQWRGVLWTAVAILAVYDASGFYSAWVLRSPQFELDRFVVRTIYLAVLAGALGYLGWYEARRRSEMLALAAWSGIPGRDRRGTMATVLGEAAGITGATIAILVWEDPVEPWSRIETWIDGVHQSDRLPPSEAGLAVLAPFSDRDFIARGSPPEGETWFAEGDELRRAAGSAVGAPVTRATGDRPVLSLAVRGAHARGRLFLAGDAIIDPELLVAGRLIAQRTAAVLDYLLLRRRLRLAAARRERLHLSRDLHDGLLQSLTGAALQLEAIDSMWDRDAARSRERLHLVQRFIADEQRQLRMLIETLRPEAGPRVTRPSLARELDELCRSFGEVWNLSVDLDAIDDSGIPRLLGRHVYSVVRESLANAVRHGRADHASVRVDRPGTDVRITIADNGSGFDLQGRWNLDELHALNAGPVSLMNRVTALGGGLVLESSPRGARLEIQLPTESHGPRQTDPHRRSG
jgi:signal transduction histidine kinase